MSAETEGGGLPPVLAELAGQAADLLPTRLRKRLDSMVDRVAEFPVTGPAGADGEPAPDGGADGELTWVVQVDADTQVTLVARQGAVRDQDDVRCSCLLAPNCLHRSAVLACCPVVDEDLLADSAGASGPEIGSAGPTAADSGNDSSTEAGTIGTAVVDAPLSEGQLRAADGLWRCAATLLESGLQATGAIERAELLRATHQARANGLYRAAAAARRLAGQLQALGGQRSQFRLDELMADLTEILEVTHQLRATSPTGPALTELLGRARATYEPGGGLRLFGLCTVPVVAGTAVAGVMTYLVDRDGVLYAVSDLAPPLGSQAVPNAASPIKLGEASFTHHDLARAGLMISGATVSPTNQLGAGKAVRAVRGSGVADWDCEPLAQLWNEPLEQQIQRSLRAQEAPPRERVAGSDLVFLTVTVQGLADDGTLLTSTAGGGPVWLAGSADHGRLAFWHNLGRLARLSGHRLKVIGRPDPQRPAVLLVLATAAGPDSEVPLKLPKESPRHIDLGFHRLHLSSFEAPISATGEDTSGQATTGEATPAAEPSLTAVEPTPEADPEATHGLGPAPMADPALTPLQQLATRVVNGGRAVEALARNESATLRAANLHSAAAIYRQLQLAARSRKRDFFGRLVADDGVAFAESWLAAAIYLRASKRTMTESSWIEVDKLAELSH